MAKDLTIVKVDRFIARHDLLRGDDKVLVGVSGGADSVCLLLILRELGYECMAVHCNFGLRGDESQADEDFVRRLCLRQEVTLHVVSFDTAAYAKEKHVSIELAARQLRYDCFSELMMREGCTKLAVGHHMDDDAETFLLNAVRKTGVRGLCGMRPMSVNAQGCVVVRPLLCLRRQETEAYLSGRGMGWVIDSTNLLDEAARNRVRHRVVPALQSVNVAAVENLCKTMRNVSEVMRVYEAEMKRQMARCTCWTDGVLCIDRGRLSECVSPISVLHEVLYPLGFNETQIANLLVARGYRSNRPKGGARQFCLRGQRGVASVEISWAEIRVRITS